MSNIDLDFTISRIGDGRIPSPMHVGQYVGDDEHVLYHTNMQNVRGCLDRGVEPPGMELSGPREKIYFDPAGLRCGIVTCGGLCPGLNQIGDIVLVCAAVVVHPGHRGLVDVEPSL